MVKKVVKITDVEARAGTRTTGPRSNDELFVNLMNAFHTNAWHYAGNREKKKHGVRKGWVRGGT